MDVDEVEIEDSNDREDDHDYSPAAAGSGPESEDEEEDPGQETIERSPVKKPKERNLRAEVLAESTRLRLERESAAKMGSGGKRKNRAGENEET